MNDFFEWLDDLPAIAAIGGLVLGLVVIKAWEWRARRRAVEGDNVPDVHGDRP